MQRASCQLSLQRTGGDHEDVPRSWAPYSSAWSNGYSPEPVCVEDVVGVHRCAILSCMSETTTLYYRRACTRRVQYGYSTYCLYYTMSYCPSIRLAVCLCDLATDEAIHWLPTLKHEREAPWCRYDLRSERSEVKERKLRSLSAFYIAIGWMS